MDRSSKNLYKTRMIVSPHFSSLPYRPRLGPKDRIFFATPGRAASLWPYQILVAGETHFPKGQDPITRRFHTHTLIYTQAGLGRIEIGGQSHIAEPQSIFWLDTAADYAHACHIEADVWSYLWFSFTGHALDALYTQLQIATAPAFMVDWGQSYFTKAVNGLSCTQDRSEAEASGLVGQILAFLAAERRLRASQSLADEKIQAIMNEMRIDLAHNWSIKELADCAQVSQSQFFRQFRRKMATTPLDWLRHERISQAKRDLIETQNRIFQVAERAGYHDPYHFSRDFKRITGLSPRDFRRSQKI